jgi:hypothetical protein
MSTETRLDRIETNMDKLLASNARLEVQVSNLLVATEPLKDVHMRLEQLEIAERAIKTWGWKTITAVVTAIATGTGIGGVLMNLFQQ